VATRIDQQNAESSAGKKMCYLIKQRGTIEIAVNTVNQDPNFVAWFWQRHKTMQLNPIGCRRLNK
jgi:hypothetical protein